MRPDQVRQFARHILLPDVGGVGQEALLQSRVAIDLTDPAGTIAARFLAASGVSVVPVPMPVPDLLVLPVVPGWWPASPDDAIALAFWRGATAAARFMGAAIARARTAHPLPTAQRAEIYAHAREAYPAECCGYVTDRAVVRCRNAQAEVAIVADRTTETAFAIDGAELFALVRSFDTHVPARVVYHSHSNGRAYFSTLDREASRVGRYPVQHLVVGVTAEGVTECAQFGWDAAAEDFVELARWEP